MRYVLFVLLMLIISSCGSSEKEREMRLQLISNELFDLNHEYIREDDTFKINGRLKNPLDCFITGLQFEIYIHEKLAVDIPDSLKQKSYTLNELKNALERRNELAKGRVIDQESVFVKKRIPAGEVRSFSSLHNIEMNIPENYIAILELTGALDNCLPF